MSTYLVTGAAGFIGSKVCELLLADGHTVVGVDNLNDYYDVRLKYYRLARLAEMGGCPADEVTSIKGQVSGADSQVSGFRSQVSLLKSDRFEFHTLDIEDLPGLERVFAAHAFNAVFNLAARAGVRASLENPELYRRTNVLGEENILKCQVKYGVRKHVVASSSSVYAGCAMPFREDAALGRMQSPYAETKRQAELLAQEYHRNHGLDVTVLRYFTVFGTAGRPDMAPYRFVHWVATGQPITLFGDGSQSRDFTYVDDIARGTILAAKPFAVGKVVRAKSEAGSEKGNGQGAASLVHNAGRGAGEQPFAPSTLPLADVQTSGFEIVNLGGGNRPLTIRSMIALIERELNEQSAKSMAHSGLEPLALGASPRAAVKAIINQQPANPLDMADTQADIGKAGRVLGWKPQTSPQEGFKQTVAWYLANAAWLKDVRP